ncbi:mpv17-like protein 2 [Mya arenaria]|uniref:mpv17-like protein 2 n=1 Tax=Mya arenaria TaxID=6604 RepID=UPI0022E17F17|nr:mpv17-like protein 2 [Mya arenaria]
MSMSKIRTVTKRLFSKHLLATNTVTSCTLLCIGDSVIQHIERLDNPGATFNYHRAGRMLSMGFLFGPVSHGWYKVLDRFLPGTALRTVVRKILADQLVAGPFFCSAFFMGMSLLEGKTVKQGFDEVKSNFITVYMIDWCVWPPAQFINFFFLPPQFRVVYVSTITLLWNCFLSWMKHREHHDHAA